MSKLMDRKDQNDETGDGDKRVPQPPGKSGGDDKTPARYGAPPKKMSPPPGQAKGAQAGFFHIYKKGQGKWTRVGTVLGAALIGGLTANFIYEETSYRQIGNFHLGYVPCLAFLVLFVILSYFLMNRPANVDFLIATDSEMKKVNWTTRAELWGSTKVIILFMFVVAIFLFLIDEFFGYFFYWIHVLKYKPM